VYTNAVRDPNAELPAAEDCCRPEAEHMAENTLELEEKSSCEALGRAAGRLWRRWPAPLRTATRSIACCRRARTRFAGSRIGVVSLVAAAILALNACSSGNKLPTPRATSESPSSAPATERVVGPLTPADAQALATMNDRLKQYLDVRTKIERSLPKLPKEATPQQIDKNQRALEKLVREARATAKTGDIFTPEARPVIQRLLASVFSGPDGKQLKASIMDEYQAKPSAVKLAVNGRYPDAVPLATVPPQVLQTLPKLTEDLEYRFIGDSLILLDVRAHVIADFIEDVVPK